jgi:hypothetical protein
MKNLTFLLAFLFASFAGISQNGVYIFGFLENGPGTPVNIHFQVNTIPSIDTVLTTNTDGSINTTWLELPNMNWTSIQTTFINCLGNQVTTVNNYGPNNLPIDAYILLNYCADDPIIFGCTDPFSISYNPAATVDDGSCEYLDCEADIFAYTNDDCSVLEFALFAADTLSISSGYWTINGEEYYGFDSWITYDAPEPGTYEVCFEGWSPYCNAGVFACAIIEVSPDCFETDCPEVYLDYNSNNCDASVYLENVSLQESVDWFVNGEGPYTFSGVWFYQFEEDGVYEFCAMYDQEGCDVEEYCTAIDVWNCGTQLVLGCMDPDALNYNPLATMDDGSCVYTTAENDLCADALPLEIGTQVIDNSNAFNNEGVWGDCWGFGSGEGEQTSIWYSFTTPNEPAAIDIVAIADGTYTLTDTQFGLFTECGGEMIYCDGNSGEGLLSAFHFSCGELEENTEYILMIDGWYGDAGTCLLSYDVTIGCDSIVYGCTDPNAINYNPNATVNDGSCTYWEDCWVYIETDQLSCNTFVFYNYLENTGWPIDGDWYVNGEFYQSNATFLTFEATEPGVYDICVEGYSLECEDYAFSCITVTVGEDCFDTSCPELFAEVDDCILSMELLNVSSNEIVQWYVNSEGPLNIAGPWLYDISEDGAYTICAFYSQEGCEILEFCTSIEVEGCGGSEIFGCTDPNAVNYNPDATVSDGSCIYWEDCWVEIQTDQINCSTFVFTNYFLNDGWSVDGDWYINGALYQWNNSLITFQASEPGTYDICFEAYMPDCEDYAFTCTVITVSEDCFGTSCPEMVIVPDSAGCGAWHYIEGGLENQIYEWYFDNNEIATGPSGIYHEYSGNGYYDVCIDYAPNEYCDAGEICAYIEITGCNEDVYGCMDSLAVNYNPLATIDDGTCIYGFECNIGFILNMNEDGTISIVPDDNILDAIEVMWTFGDGSSSYELFPVHQYEGEGPFTLCLYVLFEEEDGSTCEATFCVTLTTEMLEAAGIGSDGFILGVTDITETLGVTRLEDHTEINIFPNPGNEIVNIKITTLQAETFDMSIIDITGQIIFQESVNLNNGTGITTLNVSNYVPGMYMVSVRNSFGLLNKRFVVSR